MMEIIKVKLKKPGYGQETALVYLYADSENNTTSNDAPECDPNSGTSNCRC